jgi:hypothetical protein
VPYFFILPVFLIFEVAVLAAALVFKYQTKLRWVSGYLIGVTLGSTGGFALANVILWIVSIVPSVVAEKYSLPEIVKSIAKIIMALGLLLGPFAASAVGMGVGSALGIYLVYRRRKNSKNVDFKQKLKLEKYP